VTLHDRPLLGVGLALLVEDLRWDFDLADVVNQRGPLKCRPLVGGEIELFSDQVGVEAL
jgi:hypothetical protein